MRVVLIIFAILILAPILAGAKTITVVIDVPDEIAVLEKENEFPIIFNSSVEKWLEYYVVKERNYFVRKLRESGKYCEMMKKIFKENGLPEDLVYLALVESGFNPYAYSKAHAVGIWQFIKSTGKLFGLNQNHWIDERRDVEKSTYAAAKFLKSLYDELGSWTLAIAAYNCGSAAIKNAIEEQGTRDFWHLILPVETMAFVSKVIAAVMIARDPESYGLSKELDSPYKFEVIKITGCVDLNVIAKCCGVLLEEISILNPELTQQCTPDEPGEYPLKIPEGTKDLFLENFSKLSDKEKYLTKEEIARRRGGWVIYTVRKGDVLGRIAKKFKTTVANIKKWNPYIRKRKYICPGDKLKVFQRG